MTDLKNDFLRVLDRVINQTKAPDSKEGLLLVAMGYSLNIKTFSLSP
ncbi:MAG TPA: hypothetical protein G4N92_07420 [Anaerolineae bacterium]|nr:hypothetical protein [Anaerolineae bacterium]